MRAGPGSETRERAKKYMVKWELRDRENQVEDQQDDEVPYIYKLLGSEKLVKMKSIIIKKSSKIEPNTE